MTLKINDTAPNFDAETTKGKINFYEGNYTEYATWMKETYGQNVSEPHRLKYKKISK